MANEIEKKQNNKVVKVNDIGQVAMGKLLNQVKDFANVEKTPLTVKEQVFAFEIINAITIRVHEDKLDWNKINIAKLVTQIKSYARLGLSITDNELYLDVRNNSKTGKKDIVIKKQYQGIEKELIKWCDKKIVRFLEGVICKGDEIKTKIDFETGIRSITDHVVNEDIDRHKLENITGAYKIAYVDEGNEKLTQYVSIIDKHRIMRAYNAAATKKVWDADVTQMVLKTVSWTLYNNVLRPYISVPTDLKKDYKVTKDIEDEDINFDNAMEITAEEEIEENANKGEKISFEEDPKEDAPKKDIVNQYLEEKKVKAAAKIKRALDTSFEVETEDIPY